MRDGQSKTLLVLRATGRAPSLSLEQDVSARLHEALARTEGLEDVVLHTTHVLPPRLSLVPFRRDALAFVGVRGASAAIDALREALSPLGEVQSHLVEQSSPRARPRTWTLGELTPGVSLITRFRKKRGLDHGAFLREWHEHHTPLALATHPLVGYVRNVVLQTSPAEAPAWDGVVVESFAASEDVLSPLRFFGGARRALPGMWRVASHVPRFLELHTLENHLVCERILRESGRA